MEDRRLVKMIEQLALSTSEVTVAKEKHAGNGIFPSVAFLKWGNVLLILVYFYIEDQMRVLWLPRSRKLKGKLKQKLAFVFLQKLASCQAQPVSSVPKVIKVCRWNRQASFMCKPRFPVDCKQCSQNSRQP